MKKLSLIIFLIVSILSANAQVGSRVKIPLGAWPYYRPAWIQLPSDYNSTSNNYPVIIFGHGAGEGATGASAVDSTYQAGGYLYKIYTNAQSLPYFRENGWDGSAVNPKDGQTYKFIILNPQKEGSGFLSAAEYYKYINYLKANYRIDTNRIYLTGLSAGGEASIGYESNYDIEYKTGITRTNLPAAVVPMSASLNIPQGDSVRSTWAFQAVSDSIPNWGFGSDPSDGHGVNTHIYIDFMNLKVPGYSRFTNYSGGHCCWGQFYNPSYTENIGGTNMSIYQWMLTNKRPSGEEIPTILPPTVNAGSDQTITLPTSSVSVTGIASTQTQGQSIESYLWSKVSGGSATIVNPGNISTTISGLSQGSYVFKLTVTQTDGQTASDNLNVTVNPEGLPDCGCDVTIGRSNASDTSIYYTNSGGAVQPGMTLCIRAGYYNTISLLNLKGTAANPITIKNCGGQVVIAGDSYGGMLNVKNSEYFRFTGTGDEATQYGFYIHAPYPPAFTTRTGANAGTQTRHYSFDHFRIEGVSIGFYCRVVPGDEDSLSWHPYWNQGNVTFHDNLVRRTNGEAFYIGHNDAVDSVMWKGVKIGVEPPKFDTVRFYNNITDSTEWDGIQCSGGQPILMYDNRVTNFGLANVDGQRQGVIVGARSWGAIHNNYIKNGKGIGINSTPYSPSGSEKLLVYNNVVIGAEEFGMYFSDNTMKDGAYTGGNVYVFNNTVIQSGTKAGSNVIKVANNAGTMNSFLFKNNLIAGYTGTPIVINAITTKDTANNRVISDTSSVGFVAAGNYKLSETSPLYNFVGSNLSSYFTDDYNHVNRDGVFGIGAYKAGSEEEPEPPGVLPVIIRQFFIIKDKVKFQ